MRRVGFALASGLLLVAGCSSATSGTPQTPSPTPSVRGSVVPGSPLNTDTGTPAATSSSASGPQPVADAEFITAAEVGSGYRQVPNSKKTGASAKVSIGCLDPALATRDLNRAHLDRSVRSGLRNYQVGSDPDLFLELVINARSEHDAAAVANAFDKRLAACRKPRAHMFGVEFTISSNRGSRGVPGCADGAVYTAAFIHRAPGKAASEVLYVEIGSIVVRQGAHVGYALALSPLGAGALTNVARATAMCRHLG